MYWILVLVIVLLLVGVGYYCWKQFDNTSEDYTKMWQRTTLYNEVPDVNPESRTYYLKELPGEQGPWKKIGKSAPVVMQSSGYPRPQGQVAYTLKSNYRYILEEQPYNNGFRYRLTSSEEIKPINLVWRQQHIKNDEVIQRDPVETPGKQLYYTVKLDMKAEFDENYRPADLFGDTPSSDTKYRVGHINIPVRKM